MSDWQNQLTNYWPKEAGKCAAGFWLMNEVEVGPCVLVHWGPSGEGLNPTGDGSCDQLQIEGGLVSPVLQHRCLPSDQTHDIWTWGSRVRILQLSINFCTPQSSVGQAPFLNSSAYWNFVSSVNENSKKINDLLKFLNSRLGYCLDWGELLKSAQNEWFSRIA